MKPVELFDLFEAPKGIDIESATFVMRAPLETMVHYMGLHRDAVRRILHETQTPGQPCALHHNGRGPWAHAVHYVIRPNCSLGLTT